MTLWGYVADPLIFVVNKEVWESWTPEDRKIVKEAAIEAGSRRSSDRAQGLIAPDDAIQEVAALGVTVSGSPRRSARRS